MKPSRPMRISSVGTRRPPDDDAAVTGPFVRARVSGWLRVLGDDSDDGDDGDDSHDQDLRRVFIWLVVDDGRSGFAGDTMELEQVEWHRVPRGLDVTFGLRQASTALRLSPLGRPRCSRLKKKSTS